VREGQIVRVIDGPLTGFRGEVKEVDEQTAKVAVQVFGRVYPDGLGTWADRIGARKFKLRAMSSLAHFAGSSCTSREVREVPILLQKSKIAR